MISYEPLRILLVKEKRNFKELIRELGISPNAAVKMNNDTGNVSLENINKICNYLSRELDRIIKIEELLEFIPDPEQ